jgi:nucleoside-diphosphate-sugar epimerase
LQGYENKFRVGRFDSERDVRRFVGRINPDVVIHTACAYGKKNESLAELNEVNVRLGLLILESVECLGKTVTFINTGTALAENASPYAMTKHQFTQWGQFLANQPASPLQFFNVALQFMYGPGDDPSKFPTYVLHSCFNCRSVLELTSGEQERDFIYVDDVVGAYLTLVEKRRSLGAYANLEVGSGETVSVRKFVQMIHQLTSSTTKLDFGRLPYRLNEPMSLQANIAQMNTLGWRPRVSLKQGLKKTLDMEFGV